MKKKNISAKPGAAQPAPLSPPGAALENESREIPSTVAETLERLRTAVDVLQSGINSVRRISKLAKIDPADEDMSLALQPFRVAAGIRKDPRLAYCVRMREIDGTETERNAFFALCAANTVHGNKWANEWGRLKDLATKAALDLRNAWTGFLDGINTPEAAKVRARFDTMFYLFEDLLEVRFDDRELSSFARAVENFEDHLIDLSSYRSVNTQTIQQSVSKCEILPWHEIVEIFRARGFPVTDRTIRNWIKRGEAPKLNVTIRRDHFASESVCCNLADRLLSAQRSKENIKNMVSLQAGKTEQEKRRNERGWADGRHIE